MEVLLLQVMSSLEARSNTKVTVSASCNNVLQVIRKVVNILRTRRTNTCLIYNMMSSA